MIIDCPRCGFSQPKDRYCANCGLDIDHFKPTPEPRLKALAQNTFMQVTLVIIVIVALASGIYTAQKKSVDSQISKINSEDMQAAGTNVSSPNSLSTPPAPMATPKTLRTASPEIVSKPSAEETSIDPAAEAEVLNENKVLSDSQEETASAKGAVSTAVPPKNLNVVFLEISKSVIEQIASENQVLNEYAGTRSIMIAGQPGPNALGATAILPGGSSHPLETGKKIEMLFYPEQDPLGMRLDIDHTYHNDQEFDLEVVGQVSLRSAIEDNVINTGINGKYTIPKNATLLIVGMVPQQVIRQKDEALFARTPLAILSSAQFKTTQSQFVVLIQPK